MAEPTEDQILQKAKELCHNDGTAWDQRDFESSASGVVPLGGVAEISGRTEYLKRAKEALNREIASIKIAR